MNLIKFPKEIINADAISEIFKTDQGWGVVFITGRIKHFSLEEGEILKLWLEQVPIFKLTEETKNLKKKEES